MTLRECAKMVSEALEKGASVEEVLQFFPEKAVKVGLLLASFKLREEDAEKLAELPLPKLISLINACKSQPDPQVAITEVLLSYEIPIPLEEVDERYRALIKRYGKHTERREVTFSEIIDLVGIEDEERVVGYIEVQGEVKREVFNEPEPEEDPLAVALRDTILRFIFAEQMERQIRKGEAEVLRLVIYKTLKAARDIIDKWLHDFEEFAKLRG